MSLECAKKYGADKYGCILYNLFQNNYKFI